MVELGVNDFCLALFSAHAAGHLRSVVESHLLAGIISMDLLGILITYSHHFILVIKGFFFIRH